MYKYRTDIGDVDMKKIISVLLAAVLAVSCAVTAFAVSASEADAALEQANENFENALTSRFDADGNDKISADDARLVLLYSAGLVDEEDVAKASISDIDGDGIISAIDARTVLRVAAKVEDTAGYYTTEEKLDYFNAILNSARPNNYRLYKNGIDYTANITYKDPNSVISDLNDGVKNLGEDVDFGAALTEGKGAKKYYANTLLGSSNYARSKMPIISNPVTDTDEYLSSYLTLDDITGVVYKTNQTYTFTRYKTSDGTTNGTPVQNTSNILYTESVSGLDSLTVSLKSDANIQGEHTSKAFDVYDEDALLAEVESVANEFSSFAKEMETIANNAKFDVVPSVGSVKYYNGSITVYFRPETGKIVAAYYSVYTDYTMGLYMDVSITDKYLNGLLVNMQAKGKVDITNTTQSVSEYYYVANANGKVITTVDYTTATNGTVSGKIVSVENGNHVNWVQVANPLSK